MSTATTILYRLIEAAEQTINRPAMSYLGADAGRIEALERELIAFVDKPVADGPRLVGEYELLLAQVLRQIARARGNGERVLVLAQVAGVLLPAVRESLSAAVQAMPR